MRAGGLSGEYTLAQREVSTSVAQFELEDCYIMAHGKRVRVSSIYLLIARRRNYNERDHDVIFAPG